MVTKKIEREVFRFVSKELEEAGLPSVTVTSRLFKVEGSKARGVFCPDNGIKIQKQKDPIETLLTLLHEYAHFLQWQDYEQGKKTKRAREWEGITDSIVNNGDSPRQIYLKELASERWAEKEAHRLLSKWITIPEKYVKRSALYLYAHNFAYLKGRWLKKGWDIDKWVEDEEVYALLPTKLTGSFTSVPRKLKKICFPLF